MTKRENFNELLTIATASNRSDLVEFINHELELLDKKNKAPKKPTATQIENEKIKDEIIAVISNSEKGMTATEIVKSLDREISVSKVTALLTQLREDNTVVRTVDKRKAYFSIA